jgi:D-arginine utilization repressor
VQRWSAVCEAVVALLGPYAEVVLHDVRRDQVLAIWNPMTPRAPGDPSLLGELDRLEPSAAGVYGPYEKVLSDGRRLSCVSAVLREAPGEPSVVLCINLDRTPLDQAANLLASFAAPTAPRPESLFEQDWVDGVQQIVGTYVRSHQGPVERLTREDRLAVLSELDQAGFLAVRRSVPVVAAALRTSRSTVYALLAELKKSQPQSPRSTS